MTLKETKTAETVRVVAPATLREGYTFDVTVDGETLDVVAPPGGVREGEEFDAIVAATPAFNPAVVAVPVPGEGASAPQKILPGSIATNKTIVHNPDGTTTITEEIRYPDGRVSSSTITVPAGIPPEAAASHAASSPPASTADAPTGAWRHGLFSCFETCDSGLFWMSWCCTYIAMGQLLQRLKLNACGQPGPNYEQSCMTWTILWAASCVLWFVVVGVTEGWGAVLFLALVIAVTVALTRARHYMRRRWAIPPECCKDSGCLSDCCCVFWCPCCSVIQAMRHTHDGRVHRYNCCSPTGLDEGAPEVV